MDTKLSIHQIELSVVRYLANTRSDIIIPNLSFGLLNHEADLAIINKNGYLTEVKIKRSFEDLKADFKKSEFHKDERVYRFFYCLPLTIKEKAEALFVTNQKKLAILYGINPKSNITIVPKVLYYNEDGAICECGIDAHIGGRKLFLEEIVTTARLMSIRYWTLKLLSKEVLK